jgi:1,4-dihydroxy-6-naphthoate synthase
VDKQIAIPGQLTTAALLLRLFDAGIEQLEVMPFDRIMGAVERGAVDAGVIIHESRFTYSEYGLEQVIDLGEWWEESTGHPIPLGGILARRSLGAELIGRIDRALKQSVEYAYANPAVVRGYIRDHAQEMDEEVMQAHIDLYVNQYTLDYGADGEAAIFDLIERAEREGIVPGAEAPLFVY